MAEEQFKRNIAYKYRIGDILIGKPIFDSSTERFSFLELGNKKIVRVNIIGNIIERYDSEGEKKYSFLTLDDGSGQIKLKSFGDDVEKIKDIKQGDTVLIIGVMRHFNNELYLSPEIAKIQDPKYLLIRKLEIDKERSKSAPVAQTVPEKKEQVKEIKDQILDMIKNAESEGGITIDNITIKLREASPEMINEEIKKLLEEGIIFEPSPGKLRWLG